MVDGVGEVGDDVVCDGGVGNVGDGVWETALAASVVSGTAS